MNALPLFFLHVGQWQRYRSSGSEAMVNCTVLQRQAPVVWNLVLGEAIAAARAVLVDALGAKRTRINTYKNIRAIYDA